MKFASVLAVAAIALVSVDHVSAVSACTQDDAKQLLALSGEMLTDKNCLESANSKCPNAKCLETLEKVAKKLPNCVADGKNLKDEFEKQLKECGGSSSAVTRSTSAAVALASAVLAVAAIYL